MSERLPVSLQSPHAMPVALRLPGLAGLLGWAVLACTPADRPLTGLPATFTGLLPCADCPGIEYHLDLLPGAAYYLTMSYLDRDLGSAAVGAFGFDAATATLTLWAESPTRTQFRLTGPDTLRLLDRSGNDIESRLNYSLERQPAFEPATLALPVRGMYRYLADAGSFVECESGRSFAVAQEADNAALERAYLAARGAPGDAVLVSFDGLITMRPPMEGPELQPTVVVERFGGIWPAESCGARMSLSELIGTNWVLTRVAGEPVVLAPDQREARLVLRADDGGVAGFGGCNNFAGSYELAGGALSFGPLAANLRACPSAGQYEAPLFAALESTAAYVLFRHHLEFRDADGDLLARFEARELE